MNADAVASLQPGLSESGDQLAYEGVGLVGRDGALGIGAVDIDLEGEHEVALA